MKIKLSIAAALAIASISSYAVEQTCETGTVNCNYTDLGDKDQSADNSVSESTQNNPSSNSNQSGNILAPNTKDVNNNSNDGSITGGNTTSYGGDPIGNKSDNRNDSSARNGNQSLDSSNSFDAGTTSNTMGQGQLSKNDLANNNKTINDVSNKLGQGQSSSNKNANAQGQSSANSNKVSGSKQGQSSSNNNAMRQALSNSGNSASGSNSSNSMGRSGNSVTQVDARNNSSYSALSYRIPEINHISPITSSTPVSSTVVLQCGPYTGVRSQAVQGTYMGMFKKTMLDQGKNDTIVSAVNQHGKPVHFLTEIAADGSTLRIGSQNIITTSVISIGGSRSLNVGAGFGAGEYGQGGGGNSSQAQRVVQTVQTVPCVFDITPPSRPVQQIRYDEPETQDYSYLINGQKG